MARTCAVVGLVVACVVVGWGLAEGGLIEVEGLKMPGGASQGYVLTCDANGAATWQSPPGGIGNDNDWAVVGANMHAAVSGNVGIGTASPAAKLHVVGTAEVSGSLTVSVAGTTSNQALELKVNGERALRLEPNATCANVIGGHSSNSVRIGASSATVSGGGALASPNRVYANRATVGGGTGNVAGDGAGDVTSGSAATVGGGDINTASGNYATVGGGNNNAASGSASSVAGGDNNAASGNRATVGGGHKNAASHDYATVGGGDQNTASGDYATVAGGYDDTASGYFAAVGGGFINAASGLYATVPGGCRNTAGGDYSFAAGGRAKADHQGAFVWADSTDADFASTGKDEFSVRATGGVRLRVDTDGGGLRLEPHPVSPNVVAGASANSLATGVYGAAIGGGGYAGAANRVTEIFATVGGGRNNLAGDDAGDVADCWCATVAGGDSNTASGARSFVGGGYQNLASGAKSTVGGGEGNEATGENATVAGGSMNDAGPGASSVVAGGDQNVASGSRSAVGGGLGNTASGQDAAIAGGYTNTASESYATVGGGANNTASGEWATVPGGRLNTAAGECSFAAGKDAHANNPGSFAWADKQGEFNVSVNDRFGARACGGVYFYTNATHTSGSYLAAASGTWASVSDRNAKADIQAVEPRAVLEKLAAVPVATWRYKGEDEAIRHMGPMAQDLHAAFGLGDSEKSIGTIDADGVALAAIQGLHQVVQEKDVRIGELEARVAKLEALVERLTEQRPADGE